MAYTKGPWKVTAVPGGMAGPHFLLNGATDYIGHFYDEDGQCPNGKGNAKLMSFAPQLLERLKEMQELLLFHAEFEEEELESTKNLLDEINALCGDAV